MPRLKILVLAALAMLLAGCVITNAPPQLRFGDYPNRYTRTDFKIGWDVSSSGQGVVVETILDNVRYSSVHNLNLSVSLKRGDKTVAEKSAWMNGYLRLGDYDKFKIVLPGVSLSGGDLLQFRIRYDGTEGSATSASVVEFVADAATGEVLEP